MQGRYKAAAVVFGLLLATPGMGKDAQAAPVTPTAFAAAATYFPPNSHISSKRVEPNVQVANTAIPQMGDRTYVQHGRITGYYAAAIQKNGHHPILMEYMANIFSSPVAAKSAFQDEKRGYRVLVESDADHHRALRSPVALGQQRAFYLSADSGNDGRIFDMGHLFFLRGSVLIDVTLDFYADDQTPYGDRAAPYVWVLGKKLDAIAKIG